LWPNGGAIVEFTWRYSKKITETYIYYIQCPDRDFNQGYGVLIQP
jgi:hypothetical protein